MGYIYEKVKSVLSSNSSNNGGHVITNWSPNMYRALIFGPSFIFIAKHIGNPQIIDLDESKVMEDLMNYTNGQGRGALHNLLSERQLSCLEEIYLDVCYKPYTNLFDLRSYVSKTKNSVSRLRYYGYCRVGQSSMWLANVYQNCDVLYSLAKDEKRVFPIEYEETGTVDWYRNYNLRPMYYKMDRDSGQLAIYFRKNEKVIENLIATLKDKAEYEAENANVEVMLKRDLEDIRYAVKLSKMLSYLSNPSYSDDTVKLVDKYFKEVLRVDRGIDGLTSDKVRSLLQGKVPEERISALDKAYTIYRVYKRNDSGKLTYDKNMYSFLDIGNILDKVCVMVTDTLYQRKDTRIIAVLNIKCHLSEFPKGSFSDKYLEGKGEGTIDGYLNYLSELIGKDVNSL